MPLTQNGPGVTPVPPTARTGESTDRLSSALGRGLDLVVRILNLLLMVALVMGLAKVLVHLREVWESPTIAAGFDVLVTDLLSMFVVIELLRTIVGYAEIHRLKITFIIDATTVFVLREIMIGLFRHALTPGDVGALAGLLLVMGLIRAAAARFPPVSPGSEVTDG